MVFLLKYTGCEVIWTDSIHIKKPKLREANTLLIQSKCSRPVSKWLRLLFWARETNTSIFQSNRKHIYIWKSIYIYIYILSVWERPHSWRLIINDKLQNIACKYNVIYIHISNCSMALSTYTLIIALCEICFMI